MKRTATTGTVKVSGTATLNLPNTGCGAALDYTGYVWHFYGSYDAYSYGDYEGTTTFTAIKDANGKVSETVFKALSVKLVNRLQRLAGGRATRKASLLDNSATVGLDATVRPCLFGLEGGRDEDHLTKNVSRSLTGILAVDPSRRTTIELRGGATKSDQLGTIRFIGLSLLIRSIPKSPFG